MYIAEQDQLNNKKCMYILFFIDSDSCHVILKMTKILMVICMIGQLDVELSNLKLFFFSVGVICTLLQ